MFTNFIYNCCFAAVNMSSPNWGTWMCPLYGINNHFIYVIVTGYFSSISWSVCDYLPLTIKICWSDNLSTFDYDGFSRQVTRAADIDNIVIITKKFNWLVAGGGEKICKSVLNLEITNDPNLVLRMGSDQSSENAFILWFWFWSRF